ncbi:hypothetical protein [Candidatus Enterococcus mangumiae]|uniref:Uncharacterized protein n=1 Tax=Candidatus Enterococcus mangumiae TaxID=2230878 RepID=A0ABZ2SZ83_9ENTE|nr:hypothetical protein [Enterococcus sp. DIV1094]MBO0489013.1 hypothetical protein [Enterococcus sp. DIV1094]
MKDFLLYQIHRFFNTNTYREKLLVRMNKAIDETYNATNYPTYTGQNEIERLADKLQRSQRRKNWLPKIGDPLYKKPYSKIYLEDLQLKISEKRLDSDANDSQISRQNSTNSLPSEQQTSGTSKSELRTSESKVIDLSTHLANLSKKNDPSLKGSRKGIPRVRRTQSDFGRY